MKNRIYMFSPVVLWIVLLTASLVWNIRAVDKNMVETVNSIGRSFFKEIETTRLWNARHGGVYVSITENTQPNPYLEVPNRDVTTTEGLQLTKINPAFMTRQIAEIAKVESNIQYHITSLKPIRPANKPDGWETKTLIGFEAGNKELLGFVRGAMVYRYMAPLSVKKACLKCHAKQGYQLGDVRGGISVTIPAREYIDTVQASKNILIIIHAIALVLGIGVFYFFKRSRDKQQERAEEALEKYSEQLEQRVSERTNQLRESEEKYRTIIEDIEDGYYEVDLAGNFTFFNDSMCKIGGYPKNELMGMNYRQYTDEEAVEKIYQNYNKIYTTGKPTKGFGWRVIRKDGSEVHLETSISLINDKEGKPIGFRGIARDITERKRGEEKLKKAYEKVEAKVEERTKSLKQEAEKLAKMNKLFVDRELRMKELKEEIKKLKRRM